MTFTGNEFLRRVYLGCVKIHYLSSHPSMNKFDIMSAIPNIPFVKFTNRASNAGLSNRTPATSPTSPAGSPVFDVAAMCNPAPKVESPPKYTQGYGGYTQGQSGYAQPGYGRGYGGGTPPMMGVPTFRYGAFAGYAYQDVTDRNGDLIRLHDRASGTLTPYACGGNECNLEWDYVKWFNESYKGASITQCTQCSYTVLIQHAKFPESDEHHPGESFEQVWKNDKEYFEEMPQEAKYMNLKWLYDRRMMRTDSFPFDMPRCKHAGKSFEEVAREAPQYLGWLTKNYSGKDKSYLDAIDWWAENKPVGEEMRSPTNEVPVIKGNTAGVAPQVTTPSAGVTDTTPFPNGKHRTKTMWQVYVYDPDYFKWVESKCTSADPIYKGAIEWYHARVEKDRLKKERKERKE